jgi:outer membrane immunogenic protein
LVDSKIDQLGSVRGKIGFVPTPNLLLYGTGGLAFAHVTNTVTSITTTQYWDVKDLANNDPDAIKFYSKNTSTVSGGGTMLGWAAGVGGDWKFPLDAGSALVLGVQYLHYQFPTNTFTLTDNAGGAFAFNRSQSIDTVKGRLSYLFSIH